jgi:hypothetical protein
MVHVQDVQGQEGDGYKLRVVDDQDVSQAEIAEETDLTQSALSQFERGEGQDLGSSPRTRLEPRTGARPRAVAVLRGACGNSGSPNLIALGWRHVRRTASRRVSFIPARRGQAPHRLRVRAPTIQRR